MSVLTGAGYYYILLQRFPKTSEVDIVLVPRLFYLITFLLELRGTQIKIMNWRKTLIAFVLLFVVTVACSSTKYKDGSYCAEIQYYNPKTCTRSTYTLPIDVKDNKLVKINWSNGGWLDETHFTPPNISTGEASFTTDRGYKYQVKIINKNCK